MILPSDLRQFQTDLAGRLALHETPGEEVKALREKYGFTQEWLAGLLDLRRESLSRIESGKVALTLPVVQRLTRIVTLARAVREHLAWAEARGNLADVARLDALAQTLRLEKAEADEVVLASMMAYEAKRKAALRGVQTRRGPATAEAQSLSSSHGLPTPMHSAWTSRPKGGGLGEP